LIKDDSVKDSLDPGADLVNSHNDFPTVREMKHTSQQCCDQTIDTKWPYIANVVFRIVQNHGE